MDLLSIRFPDGETINPPSGIPKGGLAEFGGYFKNSYTILLILCIVLSLIFIIIAGIQWITSGGDKTKLQAAKSKLTWAIVGLIVAFSAFFIVGLIGYLFKVDLLQLG